MLSSITNFKVPVFKGRMIEIKNDEFGPIKMQSPPEDVFELNKILKMVKNPDRVRLTYSNPVNNQMVFDLVTIEGEQKTLELKSNGDNDMITTLKDKDNNGFRLIVTNKEANANVNVYYNVLNAIATSLAMVIERDQT